MPDRIRTNNYRFGKSSGSFRIRISTTGSHSHSFNMSFILVLMLGTGWSTASHHEGGAHHLEAVYGQDWRPGAYQHQFSLSPFYYPFTFLWLPSTHLCPHTTLLWSRCFFIILFFIRPFFMRSFFIKSKVIRSFFIMAQNLYCSFFINSFFIRLKIFKVRFLYTQNLYFYEKLSFFSLIKVQFLNKK